MKTAILGLTAALMVATALPVSTAACPTEDGILLEQDGPNLFNPSQTVHYYVTDDLPLPYVYFESNGQPGLQRNDPAVGEDNCATPDEYVL